VPDPEAPAADDLSDLDLEAPLSDAVEQAAETRPEPSYSPPSELALEADAADVSDQAAEVGVDDEDYR
jgi:hypothetical protein